MDFCVGQSGIAADFITSAFFTADKNDCFRACRFLCRRPHDSRKGQNQTRSSVGPPPSRRYKARLLC